VPPSFSFISLFKDGHHRGRRRRRTEDEEEEEVGIGMGVSNMWWRGEGG